jgi:hypothetical protein
MTRSRVESVATTVLEVAAFVFLATSRALPKPLTTLSCAMALACAACWCG